MVQKLIDHYENQSDAEAAAEDNAADQSTKFTLIAAPVELVLKVQKLLAKQAG